jgi:acetyl-CoA carboxylase alpha subunit
MRRSTTLGPEALHDHRSIVPSSPLLTLPLLQTQDIISNIFQNFVELYGDGKVGRDKCIRGGVASFSITPDSAPVACVVIATFKGHTPKSMLESNYGMPSPHGYRFAASASPFDLP